MSQPTPTWLDRLLNKLISVGGVSQPQRGTLDFASGATVTDDPANDTLHVNVVGTAGAPGQTNLTLGNGANQNVDPAGKTVLRISGPTTSFSIGGFVAPAAPVTLTLINTTSQQMTLNQQDPGSTAANRIDCQTNANLTFPPSRKSVTLVYDTNATRWQVQSTGVVRPDHLDLVQDFGADPTGSVDATTAVQNAINSAVSGPLRKLVIPAGAVLKISSTLTTNNNFSGHGTLSTGLEIVCDNARPGSSATFIWAGAAHGTIFAVREAVNLRIKGVAFNGQNIADIGLQLLHNPSTDGQDIEGCLFDQCTFGECQLYDTLVGDVSPNGPGAGGSVINCTWSSCRWERSNLGATTAASFFHRSANAISNTVINPFFDGAGGYPKDGLVVESGTVKVIGGGLSQVQRALHGGHGDFYLPTPGGTSPQVPGGLLVQGFESQSDQFIQVDDQAMGIESLYPVTLVGCSHVDTFSSGAFSIKWHRVGFASFTVVGGYYADMLRVDSEQRNVFLAGPQLARGIDPAGKPDAVQGTWHGGDESNYVDQTWAYSLPPSTAVAPIAYSFIPDAENATYDFIVDIQAFDTSTGDAACWRGLRASYTFASGAFAPVGAEVGVVGPTVSTAAAATWLISMARNVGNTHLDIKVLANNVADPTKWKIRVQAVAAYAI